MQDKINTDLENVITITIFKETHPSRNNPGECVTKFKVEAFDNRIQRPISSIELKPEKSINRNSETNPEKEIADAIIKHCSSIKFHERANSRQVEIRTVSDKYLTFSETKFGKNLSDTVLYTREYFSFENSKYFEEDFLMDYITKGLIHINREVPANT